MTPEEKAKRYDGLIERLKDLKFAYRFSPLSDTIEEKFPELKESENENIDEKVRKALIKLVTNHASMDLFIEYDIHLDEALSWIEKQSKQSNNEDVDILQRFSFYLYKDEPNVLYLSNVFVNEEYRNKGIGTKILKVADNVAKRLNCHAIRLKAKKGSNAERLYQTHGYNSLAIEESDGVWLEKQSEQKSVGKVEPKYEPKFKIGDTVKDPYGDLYHIAEITDNSYKTDDGRFILFMNEDAYRLWTIQDANDGDVLVNQNGEMPFIFKECKNNHIYCYCGYTNRKDIFFDGFVDSEGEELYWLNLYYEQAYPATEEQRNLLFQKMHEAGYEWNIKRKELKKIDNEIEIPFCAKNSELQEATYYIPKGFHAEINDDKVIIKKGEKPIVWSEEDENNLYYWLDNNKSIGNDKYRWLLSLKDRIQS